jgi:hypothetical protein
MGMQAAGNVEPVIQQQRQFWYVDFPSAGTCIAATNGWFGAVSPQLSGANTLAASNTNWMIFGSNTSAVYGRSQRSIILSGLNPGSTTVMFKYKSGQSGFTWTFQDRDLVVTPL